MRAKARIYAYFWSVSYLLPRDGTRRTDSRYQEIIMVNDPISDFVIQIKNAGAVRKEVVSVPYSKMKHAIADALVSAGYVSSATKRGKKAKKTLDVALRYEDGTHVIGGVERVSKPGRRLYTKVSDIRPVKYGKGKRMLSTPHGILTGEEARKRNVGGEELFKIW